MTKTKYHDSKKYERDEEESEGTEFDDEGPQDETDGEPGPKKNYITPPGFQILKAEYNELFHGGRPKLVEASAWAASNGGRSESGDYIYGERRLREIDRRL